MWTLFSTPKRVAKLRVAYTQACRQELIQKHVFFSFFLHFLRLSITTVGSHQINYILDQCGLQNNNCMHFTAPTGAEAMNINGSKKPLSICTFHKVFDDINLELYGLKRVNVMCVEHINYSKLMNWHLINVQDKEATGTEKEHNKK